MKLPIEDFMNDLLTAPVTTLAAMIRHRRISPVEVVDAHIARIERINPAINALAADRFAEARAEARAAEAYIMAASSPDELPPLAGVPCTIKEFLAVEGMPQTAGLLARRGMRAQRDATVVARLRRAGAIILGVSNVPEGGMWMETYNKVYGRTNNPWDLSRTAGGSSGGEAALIAAGASPFGIGSDIGGSIRIPAAFCGIAGHKPTSGLVPNTGHWGPSGSSRFLCSGPLARYVGDLEPILAIIAGPDTDDREQHTRVRSNINIRIWTNTDIPSTVHDGDLRGITIYPLEDNGFTPVSPVMRAQVRRVTDALCARGARPGALDLPMLRHILSIWANAMTLLAEEESFPSFAELLGDGRPVPLLSELVRTAMGRSRITLPALGLAMLERVTAIVPRRLRARIPPPEVLRDQLEHLVGPGGVIIHPPYPRPAPRHHAALLKPFDFTCTCIFNITGLPATQVPTGFDDRGLPVGVQIAARRGNDALTLAVAAAVEQDFGPWRMAEPVIA